MEISNEQLGDFIRLYEQRFGVRLDEKHALEKALQLLNLMSLTYKPITRSSLERLRNK